MPAGLSARLLLAALVFTGGCAALRGPDSVARPLAPAEAVADRTFQQVLRIRRGDTERHLIAAGQLCDGRLALSLLTPEGLELLRLRQRRTSVEVLRHRGLPAGLSARTVLADFQLVHWPAAALRSAWGAVWRLDEDAHGRRAVRDGEVRVRVHYADEPWHGPATLEDVAQGYHLQVKTLAHRRRAADPGEAPCAAGDGET